METKDHLELAVRISDRLMPGINDSCKNAFVLGNIIPDVNKLTYLRGFFTHQRFMGHNYGNTYDYMAKCCLKLERRKHHDMAYFYLLGKLMHYVADSFTFPHNEEYEGTLSEHCEYETRLHDFMHVRVRDINAVYNYSDVNDTIMHINLVHNKYLQGKHNQMRDCRYIVAMAEWLAVRFYENESESLISENVLIADGFTA